MEGGCEEEEEGRGQKEEQTVRELVEGREDGVRRSKEA